MPTVSHSSPLILYARIGRPDILHAVFGYPDVPPAVAAECGFGPGVKPHQDFAGTLDRIRVRPVVDAERVRVCRRRVDAGEAEAFALALETASPVTMVLDDKHGRRGASDVGLTAVGSAGVRLRAKRQAVLSTIAPVLDRLASSGLYLTDSPRATVLELAGEP